MTDSLYDPAGLDAMLSRIECVQPDSQRQWGKMDAGQMFAHCQRPLLVALGELQLSRNLLGVLFGRLAKRWLLTRPWKPGMATAPEFRVVEAREFAGEKRELLDLVRRFGEGGPAALRKDPHPFFGRMTPDEWQRLQWVHLDHHLRQFGC
jgi:hypothetical protein